MSELIPSSEEFTIYQVMAQNATKSRFFEKFGGESGILLTMLMARELGLPPMQSLMGGMNVIQGKVELSPRLMNSMIRKAGHMIESVESTNETCTLKGTRCDTKESYTCSFSIDDARRAGLIRAGSGWEKFPSDMLFARCLSRLARRLFADVISTAYVEGEIEAPEAPQAAKPPQPEELTAEVKQIESKPKEIDLEGFLAELHTRTGMQFVDAIMQEYLWFLEDQSKVPQKEIMKQALDPKHTERFLKGFSKHVPKAPVVDNQF